MPGGCMRRDDEDELCRSPADNIGRRLIINISLRAAAEAAQPTIAIRLEISHEPSQCRRILLYMMILSRPENGARR